MCVYSSLRTSSAKKEIGIEQAKTHKGSREDTSLKGLGPETGEVPRASTQALPLKSPPGDRGVRSHRDDPPVPGAKRADLDEGIKRQRLVRRTKKALSGGHHRK